MPDRRIPLFYYQVQTQGASIWKSPWRPIINAKRHELQATAEAAAARFTKRIPGQVARVVKVTASGETVISRWYGGEMEP